VGTRDPPARGAVRTLERVEPTCRTERPMTLRPPEEQLGTTRPEGISSSAHRAGGAEVESMGAER
jgi:hypothetical protein